MAPQLRFKVDENCPIEFVGMLRDLGYDAHHVNEEHLGGASDASVAARCREERRVIVTLDVDFADIRRYPPRAHFGLIVFRVADQRKQRLIAVFGTVLPLLATEPLTGWLWVVDESGVRVRAG